MVHSFFIIVELGKAPPKTAKVVRFENPFNFAALGVTQPVFNY